MPEAEASYSDGLKNRKQDGTYSFIFCLVLTSHTDLSLSVIVLFLIALYADCNYAL